MLVFFLYLFVGLSVMYSYSSFIGVNSYYKLNRIYKKWLKIITNWTHLQCICVSICDNLSQIRILLQIGTQNVLPPEAN